VLELAENLVQFQVQCVMQPNRRPSLSEHTAALLREGFQAGRWSGRLPGVWRLSGQLGVSRDVVRAALRLLEQEGVVESSGAGKSRTVANAQLPLNSRSLRVGILLPSPLQEDNAHTHELIFSIREAIEASGHRSFVAAKTARQFRYNVERVRSYLAECAADAWIIYSSRRELLEMAAEGTTPIFALGGDPFGLPISGSRADLTIPIRDCVDHLVEKGHQRIVLICPPRWRIPGPAVSAQIFLDRLSHHGIRADARYNLPDWDRTPEGLNGLLGSLFFATPPTALLIMEPECLGPVLVFLAARGERVPDSVSVVNILRDPMQAFYRPAIAHFEWQIRPHVTCVVRWVNALSSGKNHRKIYATEPVFVATGSIGPVSRRT
jgi:DNA-binding LacI/PurR family transcriptional regulator